MKKIFYYILFILLINSNLYAQDDNFTYKDSVNVFNNAYQPGELLNYSVKYGLINGGFAELSVGLEHIGHDWYYRVKAIAKTAGVVSKFARVSDRYESVIDVTTGLPLQAIRDINENNYRRYNEVIYDRKKGEVISLNTGRHKVPENTLDILSAFYFARRYIFLKSLEKNEVINLTTYFEDKIYVIKIRYKKTEEIKSNLGKVSCLKFVPVIEEGSPFEKESDMEIWFTDDGNFIPLKIKMDMGMSSVRCELLSHQKLKNPFGVKFQRN